MIVSSAENMVISMTTDMHSVGEFLRIPENWERAADDGTPDDWEPTYSTDSIWLQVVNNNELIGVISVNSETSYSVNIHPYLLKKYRHLGREMMRKLLSILFSSGVIKVNVSVPECFKSPINYVKKCGFKVEGIDRESVIRDGVLLDQVRLGITKGEFYV